MNELLTRDAATVVAMDPAERIAYFLEREAMFPVFKPNRVFRGWVRDMPRSPEPTLDYETAVGRAREMARLAVEIVEGGGGETPEFYIGEGSMVHELAKLMVRDEFDPPDYPALPGRADSAMLRLA